MLVIRLARLEVARKAMTVVIYVEDVPDAVYLALRCDGLNLRVVFNVDVHNSILSGLTACPWLIYVLTLWVCSILS